MLGSRYENEDALYRAAKQKKPWITDEDFDAALDIVFPVGMYTAADDEDLRWILDSLPPQAAASTESKAKRSAKTRSQSGPNAVEASEILRLRTESIILEDSRLKQIVEEARLSLFQMDGVPFPDDAAAATEWIREKALPPSWPTGFYPDDPLHSIEAWAILRYRDKEGRIAITPFFKDSPVRKLYEASKKVADVLQVTPEAAVAYVLVGELPVPSALEVREVPDFLPESVYSIWTNDTLQRDHLRGRAHIVITVRHPDIEPDEVAKAYSEARSKLWRVRRSRLQPRDLALVEFVRPRKEKPDWNRLVAEWNQSRPLDEAFESPAGMADSYRMAATMSAREARHVDAVLPISAQWKELILVVEGQAWGHGWEELRMEWNRLHHDKWAFEAPDQMRNAYRRADTRIFPPDKGG